MAHIHEKIDFTVEVFIVYQNKVLLRKHDKFKIWLSVGGHIELNEDPVEAAIREVKEEVGLDIELVGKLPDYEDSNDHYRQVLAPRYMGRHPVNEIHEHVVFVYFARANTDKIECQLESDKSEECVWASMEDLETMDLAPNVKFYAKNALKELVS